MFNQIPNSLLRRHLPFQEPRKLFGKYILSTILYLLDMFSHFPAPTNTFHFKNNYAWLCEREDAHVLRKYVRRRFIWRNSGIIHMFLFFFFRFHFYIMPLLHRTFCFKLRASWVQVFYMNFLIMFLVPITLFVVPMSCYFYS